ncbi:putative nuclease HARBI1 [Cucumis melo var. makuwa]|uniref:Nuclease HARBI1 n=1 Tax=Cucumis melo var. makuwa TaxID=1194695 RepID=A0A5D3DWZ0_CUCMM|nr:putative nuclease HARBI1 [Cucumis melo var. makuwa]TYK28151.1 putative nuclease HARBI1 [Cucumis melo var. makuwa]
MVVMFLYVLAHDMNNRVIQRKFVRSGETVSRHFSLMLLAVVRLHDELIKKLVPVTNHLHKSTMEVFRGTCSRSHLVYNTKGDFVYNSFRRVANSCILRDALAQPNELQVPKGYYYLYDAGYPNVKGFLIPYRGQRYHLQEWRDTRNVSTTAKEYFNMKHLSARNIIECTFDFLKSHWAILRGKSNYALQVQCRTILTCCLLHNLINREITNGEDIDNIDEGDSTYAMTTVGDDIIFSTLRSRTSGLSGRMN